MMKITLLGTGTSQGVPVIGCDCPVCQSTHPKDKRLRTSAMLEWHTHRLIIDCGTDFRTQMLRENVHHIDGILFTHEHADHTAGLDDIRPLYFKQNKPVPIFGLKRVLTDLQKRFHYIFTQENRYPGAPEVETNELTAFQPIEIAGLQITPLAVLHGNLPILGYKFNDKIAYITDAKTLPDKTIKEIKNIDLLIINALHHKKHKMHFNLQEALETIEKINPHKTVLTHISHHMGLYNDIRNKLPGNIIFGYDGFSMQV
jgi:phosphoribosyl 1,2-cyclic phosphate phosphodiesterase